MSLVAEAASFVIFDIDNELHGSKGSEPKINKNELLVALKPKGRMKKDVRVEIEADRSAPEMAE